MSSERMPFPEESVSLLRTVTAFSSLAGIPSAAAGRMPAAIAQTRMAYAVRMLLSDLSREVCIDHEPESEELAFVR
jgi:hypothetical protein